MTEGLRKPNDAAPTTGPVSETITVRPEFDLEEFARETESKIRYNGAAPPASALMPTVPPPPALPGYPLDLGATTAERGPLTYESVPALAVDRAELGWFELPSQVHLLLLYVNGCDSVADICRLAGFDPAEALSMLDDLAREGLVTEAHDNPA